MIIVFPLVKLGVYNRLGDGWKGSLRMSSKIAFVMIVGFSFAAFSGCAPSVTPTSSNPAAVTVYYPNPNPTPSQFVIWQNGTLGCYNGDCLTAQIRLQTFNDGPTTFQTTSNALEWDSNNSGICDPEFEAFLPGPENVNAYTKGHLQMDVKLALPPASYGGISVGCFDSYNLNLSLLSTTSFTHVSVPLDFPTLAYPYDYSIWSGVLFQVSIYCPGGPTYLPSTGPLLYVNNVMWTAN